MSLICINCGSEMIWGCDFSFEDYGVEGDGIVSSYSCNDCNASAEFYVPNENLPKEVENENNGN